jgi:hypothetical protein
MRTIYFNLDRGFLCENLTATTLIGSARNDLQNLTKKSFAFSFVQVKDPSLRPGAETLYFGS